MKRVIPEYKYILRLYQDGNGVIIYESKCNSEIKYFRIKEDLRKNKCFCCSKTGKSNSNCTIGIQYCVFVFFGYSHISFSSKILAECRVLGFCVLYCNNDIGCGLHTVRCSGCGASRCHYYNYLLTNSYDRNG